MHQIEHFELTTPQPVSLKLGAGCMIRVTHGRLWLTRPGHPDDVWLQAGESWTLPASDTVWIGAEPAAQFQLARAFKPWRWSGLALLRQGLSALPRRVGWPLRAAPAR
jgi:hypothetical protein